MINGAFLVKEFRTKAIINAPAAPLLILMLIQNLIQTALRLKVHWQKTNILKYILSLIPKNSLRLR
jgi:hypothetical protein